MGKHIITETIKTIVTLDTIELPENPTNGDMIRAIFPDAEITDHFEMGTPIGNIIYVRLCKYQDMRVQQNWWNAPYKGAQS